VRKRLSLLSGFLILVFGLLTTLPALASADTNDELTIRGTVRVGREVIPDAKVIVSNAQNIEIGSVVTGEDGKWEIPIPGLGEYTVVLAGPLPEGVSIRDGASDQITVFVEEYRSKAVGFQLVGEDQKPILEIRPTWERLLNRMISGLKVGLLVALASIGLSLIFGVTGLVNFAHSEMVAFGAVIALLLESTVGLNGALFPLAVALAVLAGGGLGFGLERGIFGPLRRRKMTNISLMVVSIGLAFLMRYLILIYHGAEPETFESFRIQSGVSLGPIELPAKDYFIIGIAFTTLLMVGLLLQRTKLGTSMRAVSDNPALAESSGIDVNRTIMWVWILGSALASLGGTMIGLTQVVEWQMGEKILLLIFAAVTLGGLGTAFGAMVGGLAIGFASETSTFWLDNDLKFLIALAVMIVILLVRPRGILGVRERLG
jgi:branched-chain amino acid transport system permease protein